MLNVGDPAPDFTLQNDAGEEVTLSSLRGTPRDAWGEFQRAGAAVFGASADSVKSHANFKAKYNLPFSLLADPEHQVAEQYGVWGVQKVMGIPP